MLVRKEERRWRVISCSSHISITYLPWPTSIWQCCTLCTLRSTKSDSPLSQALIESTARIGGGLLLLFFLQSFTVNRFSFHLRCVCNNNVCFFVVFFPKRRNIFIASNRTPSKTEMIVSPLPEDFTAPAAWLDQ